MIFNSDGYNTNHCNKMIIVLYRYKKTHYYNNRSTWQQKIEGRNVTWCPADNIIAQTQTAYVFTERNLDNNSDHYLVYIQYRQW